MGLQHCATAEEVRNLYRKTQRRIFQQLASPTKVPIVNRTPDAVSIVVRRPKPWAQEPWRTEVKRAIRGDPFYLQTLLREVASDYGFSVKQILSGRKFTVLCKARGAFCYRAFMETDSSLSRIATTLNRKCHTVVRNAIAVHCEQNDLPYPPTLNLDYWLSRRAAQPSGHQHRQRRLGAIKVAKPVKYPVIINLCITAELAMYLDKLVQPPQSRAQVARSLLEEVMKDDKAAHQEAA